MQLLRLSDLNDLPAYIVTVDADAPRELRLFRGYTILPDGKLFPVTPPCTLMSDACDSLHAYLERMSI